MSQAGDDSLLCADCRELLDPGPSVTCRRCGARAPEGLPPPESCRRCGAVPLHFDRVVPFGPYQDELREAVLRMKKPAGEPLAWALGQLFFHGKADQLNELRPNLLMPVPMHWRRRWARGINSPDVLAKCLGQQLRVPAAERLLYRSRNTLQQPNLPRAERFRRVKGAFSLRAGYDLRGLRVLLVDDILTTGATCSEAARILKAAGAAAVGAAVLAKSEGEGLY